MNKVNAYIFKGVTVTIIGFVCTLLCLFMGRDIIRIYLKNDVTNATVKFIRPDNSGTVVEYSVNEKNVVKDLKIYDTALRPGTVLDIYYDKKDIENSYTKSQIVCCMMVMAISVTIFFTGIYFFISYSKKQKEKAYLLKEGYLIKANIVCVRSLKFTRFFKHHPSYIYAVYEYNNDDYGFNSEETFYNLSEIIKKKKIKQVDIYVDRKDYSKYYVDIDKITAKM